VVDHDLGRDHGKGLTDQVKVDGDGSLRPQIYEPLGL
jgi:hypothetical protein